MPAAIAPLDTTIAAAAPSVRGITTTARAQRIAAELPPSPATLSMMPSADDLRAHLGLKPRNAEAGSRKSESEAAEVPATEENHEIPEEETEASADNGAETTAELVEETPEEPAPETEPEEETETLPPEAVQIRDQMQKRIDKLTAQRTEAIEAKSALEAELETARTNVERPRPTPASPLAHVLTDAELEQEIADAQQTKQWALRNRNGGEVPGKDGPIAYDADQVANILANAEAQLDAAPARREWLGHQKASRDVGAQVFPEFYAKGSPQQQILGKVMAGIPAEVKAWRPDIELLLVQALVGAAAMQERLKKSGDGKPTAAAPAPIVKVPPAPGGRTAPKAPAKVIDRRATHESNQTIAKGGQKALAAALEKRLFH